MFKKRERHEALAFHFLYFLVVMFSGHVFIIIALTGFFRNSTESTWRFLFLIGIIGICLSCCILGALFGSGKRDEEMKVKIR